MFLSTPILASFVVSTSFMLLAEALPSRGISNKTSEFSRRDVSTTAFKYLKNCQGLVDREREAWDGAQTLAKAAGLWNPGSTYQPAANLWLGADSGGFPFSKRIQANFKNAADVHDHNWLFSGNNPANDVLLETWCAEDGPDGKVPAPDGAKNWDSNSCNDRNTPFGYWGKRSRWYWLRDVHMIVLCPRVWKRRYSLAEIQNQVSNKNKEDINIDEVSASVASTYLHEIMHMIGVVANPEITDVRTAFRPNIASARPAALARWWGAATSVSDDKGGHNGEHGASINAENYALFANSLYWQELLKIADPIQPDPELKWRTFTKASMGPVPPSQVGQLTNDEAAGLAYNDTEIGVPAFNPAIPDSIGNTPEPILSDPPRLPNCETGTKATSPDYVNNLAWVFCDRIVKLPASTTGLSVVLTQADLEPPVKGATTKVLFNWLLHEPLANCAMGCMDLFTNLTNSCQFDSHTITGSPVVMQGCGSFSFEIQ